MCLMVCIGVVCRDEGRNISASLAGQIPIYLPERLRVTTSACQGFVYITRTTVVGCNGKAPVVVHLVEVLHIFAGRFCRFVGVEALVNHRVYLQTVCTCCNGHKLPQTACAHTRHRLYLQRRLDDSHCAQLYGKTCSEQLLLNHREVVLRQCQYAAHQARAIGVTLDV